MITRVFCRFVLHFTRVFSSPARVCDANGATRPGTRGLSMFYLKVRSDEDGSLNGIDVVRLKDKLGTRQLPTAELLLDGAVAHRVSLAHVYFAAAAHLSLCLRKESVYEAVFRFRKMEEEYLRSLTCLL